MLTLLFLNCHGMHGWLHLLKITMLVIFISQEDIKTSIMCNIPKTQINKRFLNYSGSSDLEDFFWHIEALKRKDQIQPWEAKKLSPELLCLISEGKKTFISRSVSIFRKDAQDSNLEREGGQVVFVIAQISVLPFRNVKYPHTPWQLYFLRNFLWKC